MTAAAHHDHHHGVIHRIKHHATNTINWVLMFMIVAVILLAIMTIFRKEIAEMFYVLGVAFVVLLSLGTFAVGAFLIYHCGSGIYTLLDHPPADHKKKLWTICLTGLLLGVVLASFGASTIYGMWKENKPSKSDTEEVSSEQQIAELKKELEVLKSGGSQKAPAITPPSSLYLSKDGSWTNIPFYAGYHMVSGGCGPGVAYRVTGANAIDPEHPELNWREGVTCVDGKLPAKLPPQAGWSPDTIVSVSSTQGLDVSIPVVIEPN